MGSVKSTSSVQILVTLHLSEEEARALQAIAGYGSREFLDTFYKYLGKSYLEPHEVGLMSLFKTITLELPPHLKRAEDARKIWNDTDKNK
jgi:hypothetical protein